MARRRAPGDPAALDLGYLGQFVGAGYANAVQTALDAAGLKGLRFAHGYVIQHLIGGDDMTVGELARRLEVTQQAASKVVAELESLGYLERLVDPADARVKHLTLTERGWLAVDVSRAARASLEKKLAAKAGERAFADARALLARVLDLLGGAAAVRSRRVKPPR